jgi:hypothetical protein
MSMKNLRNEAQYHQCTLRLDGCNTEPCCLAHYRVIGVSGMGMKSPDLIGAISCYNCHELVDRRAGKMTQQEIDAAFARGMARTIKIWITTGAIGDE